MTREKRILLKAISLLLRYPDEDFTDSLDMVEEALGDSPVTAGAVTLRTAIAALRNLPRLRLQEEYTRVFDLNPATCLNLTYHKWGDSPERAAGLAKLNQLYLDAGFEWVGGELPDFLPLVLEFLALAPKEAGVLITGQFREQIEILGSRLDSLQSTYAGILRALREAISM